jgi:hypothetical protein
MDERTKQMLEERLARRPAPLEIVREFLQYRVSGAEPEDIEAQIKSFHQLNPQRVTDIIESLEAVAAGSHPEGFLSQLVMIDGNQMLMDETDAGAQAWLVDLAARMRDWTKGA